MMSLLWPYTIVIVLSHIISFTPSTAHPMTIIRSRPREGHVIPAYDEIPDILSSWSFDSPRQHPHTTSSNSPRRELVKAKAAATTLLHLNNLAGVSGESKSESRYGMVRRGESNDDEAMNDDEDGSSNNKNKNTRTISLAAHHPFSYYITQGGMDKRGIRHRFEVDPWITPGQTRTEIEEEKARQEEISGGESSSEGKVAPKQDNEQELSQKEPEEEEEERKLLKRFYDGVSVGVGGVAMLPGMTSRHNGESREEDDEERMMLKEKRSPRCLRKCLAQGLLHPSQCHSLC